MKELLQKAKKNLQAGDIKKIADRSKIPYQTIYNALRGHCSTRQNEILKAVADFLQERKNEQERLENLLN